MPDWTVYMLRCADGSLYTGITTDVVRRLEEHRSAADAGHAAGPGHSKGAKALRGRGPLTLVFSQEVTDRAAASRMEYRIKRLTSRQKQCLIDGSMALAGLMGDEPDGSG